MAVQIVEGDRLAIGVTSLSLLYGRLDEFYKGVISGTKLASECSRFFPGHFIMGWFASLWKNTLVSASLSCSAQLPPFIIHLMGV